jgi:translation initiation factor 4G
MSRQAKVEIILPLLLASLALAFLKLLNIMHTSNNLLAGRYVADLLALSTFQLCPYSRAPVFSLQGYPGYNYSPYGYPVQTNQGGYAPPASGPSSGAATPSSRPPVTLSHPQSPAPPTATLANAATAPPWTPNPQSAVSSAAPVTSAPGAPASFARPASFAGTFNPNALDFKPQPQRNKAIKIVDPNSAKAAKPADAKADAPVANGTAKDVTVAAEKADEEKKACKEEADRARESKEAEEKAAKEKAEKEAEERRQAEKKEKEERERAEAEAKAKREEEEQLAKEKEERERAEAEKKREEEEKSKAEAEAAATAAAAATAKAEAEAKAKAEEEDNGKTAPGSPALPPSSIPSTAPASAVPSRSATPLPSSEALQPAEQEDTKKRPVPVPIDIPPANERLPKTSTDTPFSAVSASIGSARIIEDLNRVSYPKDVKSPRPDLNSGAEPGKFRYDRDFLLQFMRFCTEKPENLPSLLDSIGDGPSPVVAQRGPSMSGVGRGPPVGAGGRPGARMPSGNLPMGTFGKSEERFARSSQGGPGFGPGFPGIPMRPPPMSRSSSSQMMPGGGMIPPSVSGRGDRRSGRGRSRGTGERQATMNMSIEHVQPLQESENAWKPRVGSQAARDDPKSLDTVNRKVKALLNKLTLERFDSISDQILDWANKSREETDGRILRQVIALIFEKATDEAVWSEMYARLCRKIMERLSVDIKDEALPDVKNGGALFRKYLLTRCQEDYERGWSQRDQTAAAAKAKAKEDDMKREANAKAEAEAVKATEEGVPDVKPKEAEILSEEYYAAQKAKRRGLGLVRFIGELFKLQMLTPRIITECIYKLLANVDEPEEEDVESLCRLLTTIGKEFEERAPKGPALMTVYMDRLGELTNNPKIPSRIRFMVQVRIFITRNRCYYWSADDSVLKGCHRALS